MADHPLRSATHRRLGEPLPHQLANAPQAHPQAADCSAFPVLSMRTGRVSGISARFRTLSQPCGQVAYVLLTRPPLSRQPSARRLPFDDSARLACIRHAASVRPEPGSNSPIKAICSFLRAKPPMNERRVRNRSREQIDKRDRSSVRHRPKPRHLLNRACLLILRCFRRSPKGD